MNETSNFVARPSGEMIIDKEYVAWLSKVKQEFRSSQAKAAVRVNGSMLEFYWNLGRDIERLHAEAKWGSAFFENLSLDLRAEFPEQKGFSVTNLKYIKRWYLFHYDQIVNRQQPTDDLRQNHSDELAHEILAEFRQQPTDDLTMPQSFALLPWFQHVEIFTKCKSIEEALYYIQQSLANNWGRSTLKQKISSDLYHSIGQALTNFSNMLPQNKARRRRQYSKVPMTLDSFA